MSDFLARKNKSRRETVGKNQFYTRRVSRQISMPVGSEEEKTCRISDKDEKLVRSRDVSPSQGQSQTEEAPERAKRL